MNTNRLRQAFYPLLRALFRALPLTEGQRDRLRTRLMSRHGAWIPPPARGRDSSEAGGHSGVRLYWRADEAAIGHVPYKKESLPSPMPATLVAFYLPQFHTFPENDAWWGKGFTEWRNVTRALPQFEGHVQPRLPADLGFYDLRNPQIMRDQAQLAAEYGISAFCFYFYWFSGRTLMEAPLRQWQADDSIDLPFCLCWANENWARRWDGRDEDILIGQQHSAEDDLAFIAHIGPYLRDRRALKVDGRPMLLVYRPYLLPDARATAQRWRQWCRDHGVGDIHLAYVQGFERPDPRDIDFDAAVEFPPNLSNPRPLTADQFLINPDFQGDVRDWRELATEIGKRPMPDYPLYPGVNPSWDNEARRSGCGRVYLHASPRGYREWLSTTIHQRLAAVPTDRRMVFINAWNEWAEGAVLEPDARLGHAYLDATRQALRIPTAYEAPTRPCLVIHAWYMDVLAELLADVLASNLDWRIVITTTAEKRAEVLHALDQVGLVAEVEVFPNRGRDILPFLHVAERLYREGEQIVLKLHTKRSVHRTDGEEWRRELTGRLLDTARAARIFQCFVDTPALGAVAPEGHVQPMHFYWGANRRNVGSLLTRLGMPSADVITDTFIAGSMFWVRLAALRPLLDAHLYQSSFEPEAGQVDGTQAHAIERIISLVVRHSGYREQTAATLLKLDAQVDQHYPYARKG